MKESERKKLTAKYEARPHSMSPPNTLPAFQGGFPMGRNLDRGLSPERCPNCGNSKSKRTRRRI